MPLTLVLIRGLPGSGKSTLAETISPYHYEADQYFVQSGEYKFDKNKLGEAHASCQYWTEAAMQRMDYRVVVSNTFTTRRELEPYYDLAKKYGYQVQEIICKGDFGSIHNVPAETIEKMKRRFEYV